MQGKKILVMTLSGFAASFFVMKAFAEVAIPYGWYLEGNAGESGLTKKSYPGTSKSSGLGTNLDIGYKFLPYMSGEIGYTEYASTTIKNGATKAAVDQHYAFDIVGKGAFPVADSSFELFGKIGLARVYSRMKISDSTAASALAITAGRLNASGLYLAFGVQYNISKNIGANLQWAQAAGDAKTGTMSLVSLGMSYIFG